MGGMTEFLMLPIHVLISEPLALHPRHDAPYFAHLIRVTYVALPCQVVHAPPQMHRGHLVESSLVRPHSGLPTGYHTCLSRPQF